MNNIFDRSSDADIFGSSNSFRGMAICLLLTKEEINALASGKFVCRQIEGYGLTIGDELSFDQEYEKRMKEIDEEFNGESNEV